MNSIGILITHICGSFRQWTITNINNEEDVRDRPEEFLNENKIIKEELIELAATLKSEFLKAIHNLDTSGLTEQRRIQGYDVTLMSAIFRALTHLEGHIGQIVLLTRIKLGDNYKMFWTPQTDEQRAELKNII
jgi:alkylation response protein AidB-like acyl-CoA dehydrogenase